METILHQLSGKISPIGQKIEQATDPSLPNEDWNLNMEICDMINDTDEGPRDAIRAIKRRFQQFSGKNHTAIMYTLTVLETCVKNCGRRFHLLVTNKDFVQDLIKLIGPKNDPPAILQERVLSLIQTWSDTFRGQPDLSGVVHVCNDLKAKGVEFPPTNYECMVPIHTPQRTVQMNLPQYHLASGSNPNYLSDNNSVSLNSEDYRFNSNMPKEDIFKKIRNELDIVIGNAKVLDEMVSELSKTDTPQDEDLELLFELNSTCQLMQKRVLELINKISDEEITEELLTINDNLNSLFVRFNVFCNKKNKLNRQIVSSSPKNVSKNQNKKINEDKNVLIDLDSESKSDFVDALEKLNLGAIGGMNLAHNPIKPQNFPTTTNAILNVKKNNGENDFDIFAQSRSDKIDESEIPNEKEIDEMDKWLKEQISSGPQDSLSNSEFDKFLAERANNLEKQPNLTPKKSYTQQNKDLFDL